MTERPLWIGTAGWSVPARYGADVAAGGSQLERYARALNAAEINSSFYRPHRRETYERWAEATPSTSASRSSCRGRSPISPGSRTATPCLAASSTR